MCGKHSLRVREVWDDKEGYSSWGGRGHHLVATSNLSLTRLTRQPLAPCFFLSVSQSSGVSKRGIGDFLEPELWPRAGVRHRRERGQLLSSFCLQPASDFSDSIFSLSQSTLTHQPCSGLSLNTVGFDCSELWLGQWPWSPVEESTSSFWLRLK